ncbi:Leucine-responsive regulatory protein [Thalassovita gelatinovora]|uniref:Leucine-responsive regulatory protein n=1 Tax=Thalassovita gelatinovora TaxID=53501 RepID=A0A0P1F9R3_THAGE|nr:Lrp/AsnC family transcriptional regulator [Thalassovita gelatinovora]QIZ81138.1 Lrp/AsnC family transcriptional regulator [Thalassovita gelatinovora]CUH64836.1 Leucine-responsive regulatory protein [Thalassovita gelatinovora]SEP91231.1 transcriptional regulator, AsnC family [Thalassovita gelatinovora]
MTEPRPRKTGSKPIATMTFDETDQRILEILQHDSDTPIQAISEAVGLSTNPCWRRIKRMEEAGVIKKRVVLVDQTRANVPLTVFIGISTSRHEIEWLHRFRELIDEIPEVVEAYRLTGTVDYILKVVVPDMDSYDAVYKQMIRRLEFSQVNSMISMEELKFTTAIPTTYL